MAKNLLIVESPTKAKTIGKYLNKDYQVVASFGHVRDLIAKKEAINPEQNFAMHYEIIEKHLKHVENIIKNAKKSQAIYLATDPDREGEAICWHIIEILKDKNVLEGKTIHRVVFHEITKKAVEEALKNPRDILMDLVNAQQARRALDLLVGFELSPLLWKVIRWGLSAGRVQSPALRLIVDRELEIEAFKQQEYWTISAQLEANKQAFSAKLIVYAGDKLTQFSFTQEEQTEAARQVLIKAAQGRLRVAKVERKQRKRYPAAPFITSTLQQEAARKIGLSAQKTMRIAQQLYEGIDLAQGHTGLITYMRTDSVHLNQDAVESIRQLIASRYGASEVPKTPPKYRTKTKNAQEAHEAIRPTNINLTPESLAGQLTNEQLKLYDLIWKRTIAAQMCPALIGLVSIDFSAPPNHSFRATGSSILEPGFLKVYEEGQDEAAHNGGTDNLPLLKEDEEVQVQDILKQQHFTEPPPRYTEATLIKSLEELGIGRPSTYAAILSILLQREYVILDQKKFKPTDVGRVVNRFLTQYFTLYVDYDFTAKLEEQLDEIAKGKKEWILVLEDFWKPFKNLVTSIEKNVKKQDVTQESLEESCPQCGKQLSIRLGRRGRFIGCSGYPDCDYTRNLQEEETKPAENLPDRECPECHSPLQIKQGRYGQFIGCTNYPQCHFIESLNKPLDTQIECPECHQGSLLKRKSRRGKIFYSCSTYPTCAYATWDQPIAQPCPQCAWPILTIKTTQRDGTRHICPRKTCGYKSEPIQE